MSSVDLVAAIDAGDVPGLRRLLEGGFDVDAVLSSLSPESRALAFRPAVELVGKGLPPLLPPWCACLAGSRDRGCQLRTAQPSKVAAARRPRRTRSAPWRSAPRFQNSPAPPLHHVRPTLPNLGGVRTSPCPIQRACSGLTQAIRAHDNTEKQYRNANTQIATQVARCMFEYATLRLGP